MTLGWFRMGRAACPAALRASILLACALDLSCGRGSSSRTPAVVPITSAASYVLRPVRPNDLSGRTITFMPADGGYRAQPTRYAMRLDWGQRRYGWESERRQGPVVWKVDLPFGFPLGGRTWRQLWISSRGTISFPVPEDVLLPKSLIWPDATMRYTAAVFQARAQNRAAGIVAPLWNMWTGGTREVFTRIGRDEAVVTWRIARQRTSVADHDPAGENLFQAVLYRDGRVAFSYGRIAELDGIAGIFAPVPGGERVPDVDDKAHCQATSRLPVNYERDLPGETDLSTGGSTAGGSLFEVFHHPVVSRVPDRILRDAYTARPPRDDFAVVFTDFRIDALYAFGCGIGPLNVPIKGLGEVNENPESGRPFGSDRLQQTMNPVWVGASAFSEFADGLVDYGAGVSWIGHEIGHRWVVRPDLAIGEDPDAEALTVDKQHWSGALHAPSMATLSQHYRGKSAPECSLMGGGLWSARDGQVYSVREAVTMPSGFSALDLYAMGLIPASEVPETFLAPRTTPSGETLPKRPVLIKDIVARMGPRLPDAGRAQKQFTLSVFLLHDPSREADEDLIGRSGQLGAATPVFFDLATGSRMHVKIESSRRE